MGPPCRFTTQREAPIRPRQSLATSKPPNPVQEALLKVANIVKCYQSRINVVVLLVVVIRFMDSRFYCVSSEA